MIRAARFIKTPDQNSGGVMPTSSHEANRESTNMVVIGNSGEDPSWLNMAAPYLFRQKKNHTTEYCSLLFLLCRHFLRPLPLISKVHEGGPGRVDAGCCMFGCPPDVLNQARRMCQVLA
jgi:hypothetical protein